MKAGLIWSALTQAPPESTKIAPRKMVSVPSVTTIDGMSSFQTSRPLMAPSASADDERDDDQQRDRDARDRRR